MSRIKFSGKQCQGTPLGDGGLSTPLGDGG